MLVQTVFDKTAHKQIEIAVIVVVEPDRAGCPARGGEARFLSYISESAIAVIPIQDTPAVGRYKDVWIAIVVIVTHGHPHSESAASHARLFRDVSKGAVPVVLAQRVPDRFRGFIEVASPAIHQVDIHPPVIIIIQKGAAGTHSFGQVSFRRKCVVVYPGDPGG